MDNLLVGLSSIIAIGVVIFMLLKNMDIKFTLLFAGMGLMYLALGIGNTIQFKGFESTGAFLLDPIMVIPEQFVSTLSRAGIIILILGGYAKYMQHIKASDVTVYMLTKPLAKIKTPYKLIPFVFLIGNFLSLVIPSASNLAIILLATLYPVLRQAGMSSLTAAALIATSATVVPTPLGGDNVAITQELAHTAEFAGLTVSEYVFEYHALVSIPTLIFMAILHVFWQRYMDSKGVAESGESTADTGVSEEKYHVTGSSLYKICYSILPLLPIVILFATYTLNIFDIADVQVSVGLSAFTSLFIAVIFELIRTRDFKETLNNTNSFFIGMGNAMSVVALLVSASIFVVGLKSIGLISELQSYMQSVDSSGFTLPLTLLLFTALITILSGSGLALFYAMVPLMVPLAMAADISPLAVTLPMGMGGNLLRACSPVAAVIIIIAGVTKHNPMDIVKRTAVPSVGATIFMFLLSMYIYI
ncbi:C4-dicarboxylate transporter DcuC [Photobacterium sp.]|uniref:C4-dicarboxylate transporter DcuC n=1 Tax=Photobacterium sp. TaxID=660 RepID=UPI00299DF228|nr:C4-dicarboxylate transporter DcuC [Photobacterium sp.]MDX1303373.1 C4-dicarboxylate transporter DcuC [Photobacterium sp.]